MGDELIGFRTLQGAECEVRKVRGFDRPHHPPPPLGGGGADGHEAAALQGAEIRGAGRILGVDLGGKGALALLDTAGTLLDVADMPVVPDGGKARSSVQPALLAALLREWQPSRAFVEFVAARPTGSKVGAFAFGKARGHVEAVLATLGVPYTLLTPATWKRAVNIPPGNGQKSTARAEACRRWPDHATKFARVKDDGRAEAALIAIAGMMRDAHNIKIRSAD